LKFIIEKFTSIFVANSLKKTTFFKKRAESDIGFFKEDIIVDPVGTYTKDKSIAAASLRNEGLYVFSLNKRKTCWKNYNVVIVNNKDVKVLND
jgi:hypothetical protein